MDLKKLAPWNWFKKEDEEAGTIPVRVNRPVEEPGAMDAYQPLYHVQRQMERFFDSFFRDFGGGRTWSAGEMKSLLHGGFLKPSVNVGGTDTEYSITVEIPGVDEKDVSVEVHDNTLTISGEKRHEVEDKQRDFYRIERSYGSFRRVLTLPDDADQERINATFRKGVLTLSIPKKAVAAAAVKQIEIKSAD